jgi:hypothetical protein
VGSKAAAVEARLDAKQADLDDIKARIAQLDQTLTGATKGHTRTTTVGNQGPVRDTPAARSCGGCDRQCPH